MPHPDEPTQIQFSASVVESTAVSQRIREQNEFIDPRGQYATTPEMDQEFDSSGGQCLFKVENEGIDLSLAALHFNVSQGAEDGRMQWNVGWDTAVSTDEAQYAERTLLSNHGVATGSGQTRNADVVWFPEDLRPLWEFKDTLYFQAGGDSTSADTVKGAVEAIVLPAHEATGGRL